MTVPPGDPVTIRIDHYDADGGATPTTTTTPSETHTYSGSAYTAGQFVTVVLDANQISTQLVESQYVAANGASLTCVNDEASNGHNPPSQSHMFAYVGQLQELVGLKYFQAVNSALQTICELSGAVPLWGETIAGSTATSSVSAELVSSSTTSSRAEDLSQDFPILPDNMVLDVGNHAPSEVPINGENQPGGQNQTCPGPTTGASQNEDLLRRTLIAFSDLAEESAVWEGIVNVQTLSSVSSLQMARTAPSSGSGSNQVVEIAPYDPNNVIPTLDFSPGDIAQITADVDSPSNPYTVYTPVNDTLLNGVSEVGYIAFVVVQNEGETIYNFLESVTGGYSGGVVSTTAPALVDSPPAFPTVADLPQGALNSPSPSQSAGDPVNVANGDVTHQETDVSIPNLGVPLTFTRYYNSNYQSANAPDFGMGPGWSFSFCDRLTPYPSTTASVTWFTDTGLKLTFTPLGTTAGVTTYQPPDGVFGSLVYNASVGYTWTATDGDTYAFDTAGRLVSEKDRFGNGAPSATSAPPARSPRLRGPPPRRRSSRSPTTARARKPHPLDRRFGQPRAHLDVHLHHQPGLGDGFRRDNDAGWRQLRLLHRPGPLRTARIDHRPRRQHNNVQLLWQRPRLQVADAAAAPRWSLRTSSAAPPASPTSWATPVTTPMTATGLLRRPTPTVRPIRTPISQATLTPPGCWRQRRTHTGSRPGTITMIPTGTSAG